jgi:hypothetical protein
MPKPKKLKSDLKGLASREAGDVSDGNLGTSARAKTGPKAPRNAEKLEEVCHLLAKGHSVEAACVGANLSRTSFYRWMEQDEELRDRIDDAKIAGEGAMIAEMRSLIEMKQDWKGLAWLLERRWPERYSAKREIEVSTKKADGTAEVLAMLEQTNEMLREPDESDDQ